MGQGIEKHLAYYNILDLIIMEEPYKQWAQYYDLFSSEEQTEMELGFIEFIFEKYGDGQVKKILDATCGTGRHAIPLAEKGYDILANDRSPEMLAIARGKASNLEDQLSFNQGDIRELEWHEEFDAVITINSAFNYMHTDEDAEKALQSFYNALKPGGLAIVDLANFYRFFAEYKNEISSEHEMDGLTGKRVGKHSIHTKTAMFFHEEKSQIFDSGGEIIHEIHEMHQLRMFNYHEILRFLKGIGFSKIMCFSKFEDREEAGDDANRLIFVAIK